MALPQELTGNRHIEGEQSHDGYDGDSDNQGPPPPGDYPAEAWASKSAVRSPLSFSFASQRLGSRRDNNHMSSTDVNGHKFPISQHEQQQQQQQQQQGGHLRKTTQMQMRNGESQNKSTQTGKGGKRQATQVDIMDQNIVVSAMRQPRAAHNTTLDGVHDMAKSNKKQDHETTTRKRKRQSDLGSDSRCELDKKRPRRTASASNPRLGPDVYAHGLLKSSSTRVSGNTSSKNSQAPYSTADSTNHLAGSSTPFNYELPGRYEHNHSVQDHIGGYGGHVQSSTLPTSSLDTPGLHSPARIDHQYQNSDLSPHRGWLPFNSAGHIDENFTRSFPFGQSLSQEPAGTETEPTRDTVRGSFPLQMAYAATPGSSTGLHSNDNNDNNDNDGNNGNSSNHRDFFLSSANNAEATPFQSRHEPPRLAHAQSSPSAIHPRSFASTSVPLPPPLPLPLPLLTISGFSSDTMSSANDYSSLCQVGSGGDSGTWTATSPPLSSVGPSQEARLYHH